MASHILKQVAHPIQTGLDGAHVYAITVDTAAMYVGISIGPEVHIARRLINGQYPSCPSEFTHQCIGAYVTNLILPVPPQLPGSVKTSDTRVRARSLEFIKSTNSLLVSYLNHGIVCVLSHFSCPLAY